MTPRPSGWDERQMVPAPRKPMPVTIWAATRLLSWFVPSPSPP